MILPKEIFFLNLNWKNLIGNGSFKNTLDSTALKQRNHIFEYWNERNRSNSYSKKLKNKISHLINNLKTNPRIGNKSNFNNTRSISLGHYSILYKITDVNIIITGFWDNRQNPETLLTFLKQQ